MENCKVVNLLDEDNPVGKPLTARHRRGFAFKTIGYRLPVILTKVIDQMSRDKNEIGDKLGQEARDEVKKVVGLLAKLKNEMITNKPIVEIEGENIWNSYLHYVAKQYFSTEGVEEVKWFFAPWLFVECYLYKRISESFRATTHLKTYDPFQRQKEEGFHESIKSAETLSVFMEKLTSNENSNFNSNYEDVLLQVSLWGNRCDLSISCGEQTNAQEIDLIGQLDVLKPFILCNDSEKFWSTLNNNTSSVGFIVDNAGFELFTDLCLADALLHFKRVNSINFYVKALPWFVSDAMEGDFHWLINTMCSTSNSSLSKLGLRWKSYVDEGKWKIITHQFWTYPHSFNEMQSTDPELYRQLGNESALIFKGDLNYRKLIGDVNWPHDTQFQEALRGFTPCPLVSLRTLKADCVAGLQSGLSEKLFKKHNDTWEWMVSGEYATIQFAK